MFISDNLLFLKVKYFNSVKFKGSDTIIFFISLLFKCNFSITNLTFLWILIDDKRFQLKSKSFNSLKSKFSKLIQ